MSLCVSAKCPKARSTALLILARKHAALAVTSTFVYILSRTSAGNRRLKTYVNPSLILYMALRMSLSKRGFSMPCSRCSYCLYFPRGRSKVPATSLRIARHKVIVTIGLCSARPSRRRASIGLSSQEAAIAFRRVLFTRGAEPSHVLLVTPRPNTSHPVAALGV